MKCIKCGVEIPKARLKALPGTKTCVNHSSAEKKVGTPIMIGEGDHTCIELNIMDAEEYRQIEKIKNTLRPSLYEGKSSE
jgi:malate/lactate dehydrogenase